MRRNELIELRRKNQPRTNQQRSNTRRIATAGKPLVQALKIILDRIERQRALIILGPAHRFVMPVAVRLAIVDDVRPTTHGLLHRKQHRVQTTLKLPQPKPRSVKRLGIRNRNPMRTRLLTNNPAQQPVKIGSFVDCGFRSSDVRIAKQHPDLRPPTSDLSPH